MRHVLDYFTEVSQERLHAAVQLGARSWQQQSVLDCFAGFLRCWVAGLLFTAVSQQSALRRQQHQAVWYTVSLSPTLPLYLAILSPPSVPSLSL